MANRIISVHAEIYGMGNTRLCCHLVGSRSLIDLSLYGRMGKLVQFWRIVLLLKPLTQYSFIFGLESLQDLFRPRDHAAQDINPGPEYKPILLRFIPGDIYSSTCPHRVFHTLTDVLHTYRRGAGVAVVQWAATRRPRLRFPVGTV